MHCIAGESSVMYRVDTIAIRMSEHGLFRSVAVCIVGWVCRYRAVSCGVA